MTNIYKFNVSYQEGKRYVDATKVTQVSEAYRDVQKRTFVVDDSTLSINLEFIKEAFNNVQ